MEFADLLRSAAVAALCFNVCVASADDIDTSTVRDPSETWFLHLTLENFALDKKAATKEGIGTSALALGFEGEYFFNNAWSTSFGMSYLSYDDKSRFEVVVQNTTTDRIKTASSDASALPIYGDIGYKAFFGGEKTESYLTARAGLSALIDSSRDVASCTDCPSEKIDIAGGFYAVLGAGLKFGETWGMGVHYKNYFSGDITNVIGVSITWGY